MKTLFIALIVSVGVGTFVAGQALPQRRVSYPGTTITAGDIRYNEQERVSYARGDVRIVTDSSTITADEADLHLLRVTQEVVDLDIAVRGNVRILVTPERRVIQ
ncbi:MAG: hypothetical protein AB7F99_13765 [Vicinamibacterales bacterium]